MSCDEISADWASQRIKGLSLSKAIINSLISPNANQDRAKVTKSLINSFRYPRKGPGQMWEVTAERIKEMGGKLFMGTHVC
jgi:protoporphyrinogen oxidase